MPPNKHANERNREIAEQNTILLTQVGSGLHGVTVTGTDDRDEMGLCIEPASCVIGLERFDQYQYRTQPEGVRSGAGDLDLVIYSLRKWARLAAQGNPTVLLLLFAPVEEWVITSDLDWGRRVQAAQDLFISRDAGARFIGYLDAQRDRMLGLRNQRTNRPELVDVFGFDTKFAYHAVRLGIQGVELLSSGHIELPIAEPDRTWLTDLRYGKHSKSEALERIADLRNSLEVLRNTADLPVTPDYDQINKWLTTMYQEWWDTHDLRFSGPLRTGRASSTQRHAIRAGGAVSHRSCVAGNSRSAR